MSQYGPLIQDSNYKSPTYGKFIDNPQYTGGTIAPYNPTTGASVSTLSSADGNNHFNTTGAATVSNENTAIKEQATRVAAEKAAADAQKLAEAKSAPTPTTEKPADDGLSSVMNTPEVGNVYVYNTHSGERQEVSGVGGLAEMARAGNQGWTMTEPTNDAKINQQGGVATTIPLDNDTGSVVQFGNGTYGKLDNKGKLIGTLSAQEFDAAKEGSQKYKIGVEQKELADISSKMSQISNGSYPLAPWQQDVINGIKQQYASLIAKQQTENANYEGGTATLEGRLGMSQYSPGIAMGAMKAAVDQGISKIADLNAQLGAAVGKMTSAFQTENMDLFKSAFDAHQNLLDRRQAAVDKMAAAVKAEQDRQDKLTKERNDRADALAKEANDKKQAEDRLTLDKVIHDDTKSYQEKQQAIASAQLSETERHNKATELEAQRKRLQDAMGEHFDPNTPFASTISSVSRNVSRLDRASFMTQVSESAKRGDYKTMLVDMKKAATDGLPAADKVKLNAHENAVDYLTNMDNLLKEFEKNNIDTGILKGTYQDVSTRLGQLGTDPKYTALATAMNDNFVRFRADITGAAFSPEESRGYEALVPMGDKSLALNHAIIDGAKMYAQQQVDSVYGRQMGKEGYQNLSGIVQSEDVIGKYGDEHPEVVPKIIQMQADGKDLGFIREALGL